MMQQKLETAVEMKTVEHKVRLIQLRMDKVTRQEAINIREDIEKVELSLLLVGMQAYSATPENRMECPEKVRIELP